MFVKLISNIASIFNGSRVTPTCIWNSTVLSVMQVLSMRCRITPKDSYHIYMFKKELSKELNIVKKLVQSSSYIITLVLSPSLSTWPRFFLVIVLISICSIALFTTSFRKHLAKLNCDPSTYRDRIRTKIVSSTFRPIGNSKKFSNVCVSLPYNSSISSSFFNILEFLHSL